MPKPIKVVLDTEQYKYFKKGIENWGTEKSIEYFKKSVDSEISDFTLLAKTHYNLGCCYFEQDKYTLALKHFGLFRSTKKSHFDEDVKGKVIYYIGKCHQHLADNKESFRWYKQGKEMGDKWCMINYARCLLEGTSTEMRIKEGYKILNEFTETDDQYPLALYLRAIEDYCKKYKETAIKKSAELGCPEACMYLLSDMIGKEGIEYAKKILTRESDDVEEDCKHRALGWIYINLTKSIKYPIHDVWPKHLDVYKDQCQKGIFSKVMIHTVLLFFDLGSAGSNKVLEYLSQKKDDIDFFRDIFVMDSFERLLLGKHAAEQYILLLGKKDEEGYLDYLYNKYGSCKDFIDVISSTSKQDISRLLVKDKNISQILKSLVKKEHEKSVVENYSVVKRYAEEGDMKAKLILAMIAEYSPPGLKEV